MVGVLASCNALEPIFEEVTSNDIEPSVLVQESVIVGVT